MQFIEQCVVCRFFPSAYPVFSILTFQPSEFIVLLIRRLALALFFAAFALSPLTPIHADVIDRVLVVVNDDIITESEFVQAVQRAFNDLRRSGERMPDQAVLENQVMEQLILERIQLQIAEQLEITVSDSQVDNAIRDIASRQKVSTDELIRRVRSSGLSLKQYRRMLVRQIKVQRVVDREVRRRILVTNTEIDTYLSGQKNTESNADIEYEVAHISLGALSDREGLKARAEQIRAELEAGTDFAILARRHSDSGDADQGGYLGWRTAETLPDIFIDAIRVLDVDSYSEVLEGPNGFHILYLIDRRGGGRYVVDQWRSRHILVQVDADRSLEDAMDAARLLKNRIAQGEDFATLARVHSDDSRSRVKGGDLDWLSPGDTVSEYEEALRNLRPNEVSEPIRSRFGVHIIQLLDQRKHDIGQDRLRRQAELALRESKGDDLYKEWLGRIREEAYVKFRVNPNN